MSFSVEDYRDVGSLLILILGTIYLFYSPSSEDKNNLMYIHGALSNPPEYIELGDAGENKHLILHIDKYDTSFDIESCAYYRTNSDNLLSLIKGDSIKVLVRKERTWRENIHNDYDVYEVISPKYGTLLSLENTNKCYNSSWKRVGIISMLLGLTIAIGLYKKFRNKTN